MIRPEHTKDFAAIDSLLNAAFQQESESLLVQELRDTSEFISDFSLVLELESRVSGYLLLYPISITSGKFEIQSLALAPMAVLPENQNQGWGGRLVEHALVHAKSKGWGSVIVLGHPKYYPKFGFQPASYFKVSGPFEVPDEVFMAIELMPQALESGGQVVYPAPFMKF